MLENAVRRGKTRSEHDRAVSLNKRYSSAVRIMVPIREADSSASSKKDVIKTGDLLETVSREQFENELV